MPTMKQPITAPFLMMFSEQLLRKCHSFWFLWSMKYSTLLTVKKNILNSCGTNIMKNMALWLQILLSRLAITFIIWNASPRKTKRWLYECSSMIFRLRSSTLLMKMTKSGKLNFHSPAFSISVTTVISPTITKRSWSLRMDKKCATVFQFYRQKSIPLTAFLRNGCWFCYRIIFYGMSTFWSTTGWIPESYNNC